MNPGRHRAAESEGRRRASASIPKESDTRPSITNKLLRALIAAAITTTFGTAVPAQGAAHSHEATAEHQLALDHGRKWATDEPLRAGMSRIRGLVEPQLGAAHAGKLGTAQYKALASKIEAEVGGIVANCKLDPKADAMLHLVLADIGEGTDAMAGKNPKQRPVNGLAMVVEAVNQCGSYFDHPGFEPIRDH